MTMMLTIMQRSSPPKQVPTPMTATMKIAAARMRTVVRLQLRLALIDGVDKAPPPEASITGREERREETARETTRRGSINEKLRMNGFQLTDD